MIYQDRLRTSIMIKPVFKRKIPKTGRGSFRWYHRTEGADALQCLQPALRLRIELIEGGAHVCEACGSTTISRSLPANESLFQLSVASCPEPVWANDARFHCLAQEKCIETKAFSAFCPSHLLAVEQRADRWALPKTRVCVPERGS